MPETWANRYFIKLKISSFQLDGSYFLITRAITWRTIQRVILLMLPDFLKKKISDILQLIEIQCFTNMYINCYFLFRRKLVTFNQTFSPSSGILNRDTSCELTKTYLKENYHLKLACSFCTRKIKTEINFTNNYQCTSNGFSRVK